MKTLKLNAEYNIWLYSSFSGSCYRHQLFWIHLFHQITDSWSFVFAGNFRIGINELFLIFKQQFKHNIVMTTNHWTCNFLLKEHISQALCTIKWCSIFSAVLFNMILVIHNIQGKGGIVFLQFVFRKIRSSSYPLFQFFTIGHFYIFLLMEYLTITKLSISTLIPV